MSDCSLDDKKQKVPHENVWMTQKVPHKNVVDFVISLIFSIFAAKIQYME